VEGWSVQVAAGGGSDVTGNVVGIRGPAEVVGRRDVGEEVEPVLVAEEPARVDERLGADHDRQVDHRLRLTAHLDGTDAELLLHPPGRREPLPSVGPTPRAYRRSTRARWSRLGGAGAHGAGFQGGVEGAAGEAPAAQGRGGLADREEFGVGGRVFGGLALVGGDGQDLPFSGDHGAHGGLALFGGARGGEQGAAHHGQVRGGLIFVHRADDSREMVKGVSEPSLAVSAKELATWQM
jgi:hypothetical protein